MSREQRHRPDLVGLVLDVVALPSPFVAAYEVWPGASAEPEARQLLERIAQHSRIYVIAPERALRYWQAEQRTVGLFD